ncbi:DsbA family oxidoreductase [uncultured Desulfovibrio sp.]|uniref:DsbA family oxidoreductase n=1 Tax=uncultured Desulfovibrio sp. TaxID=167968 RepID=UPI00261B4EB7|nr:DsbA family oxidoreductase [uncultured Desulfovibrio sp.]
MHIELWSDFACPYCYIGEARLRRALRELKAERDVVVTMKSFELDPTADREATTTTPERFARKYGLSLAAATAQIEHISQLGRDEGIDFRYASANYSNMLDAHRLAKYGMEQGHPEISERLFAAYFTENCNLADHAVLMRIAESAGLAADETRAVLESGRYEDAVRRDEDEAARLGIHGVPYFYIDRKVAVGGAQPYSMMRKTLADLLVCERTPEPKAAMTCGPDGCRI